MSKSGNVLSPNHPPSGKDFVERPSAIYLNLLDEPVMIILTYHLPGRLFLVRRTYVSDSLECSFVTIFKGNNESNPQGSKTMMFGSSVR